MTTTDPRFTPAELGNRPIFRDFRGWCWLFYAAADRYHAHFALPWDGQKPETAAVGYYEGVVALAKHAGVAVTWLSPEGYEAASGLKIRVTTAEAA